VALNTITITIEKTLNLFVLGSETGRKVSLQLYWLISYIFTNNVCTYCVYPAMLKSSRQMPNGLIKAKTIVILIVFRGVLYQAQAYTVTISCHLFYMNQVPVIFWSVTI
jgi:hypothetical protein